MPTRSQSVHRIFALACELDGEERASCLRRECGGDVALRAEVEELLRIDAESDYLEEERLALLRRELGVADEPMPERIGGFRVVGLLGRGGMGVVYRAVQENPAREIALKVLAPGLGGGEATGRFALEAEALGRLHHPGIAQIYEAGTDDSANGPRPYLAMELVHGEPLLDWVARTAPSLEERVEVLIQVCEAVHHAHLKGLVHRDLKPGNVFVDEQGRAKVLDFGIARFVADERDRTLVTRTGQLLGTLAYMSPEQADGLSDRIDARTDVYAIGAIGYQLVTGILPVDVTDDPLTVGLRRLVHEEPTPLGEVDRRLRGDLQNVIAKALRKEQERRYDSARGLADDLRRFLTHQPVLARPATAVYVLRRFGRRHRGLVAGLLVAVLAMVGGTIASISWALRADVAQRSATAEARVARRVADFVVGLFSAAAPRVALGDPILAKDIVLEGQRSIREDLADEPLLRARLSHVLGGTLEEMGEYAAAAPMLDDAIDAQRGLVDGDDAVLGEMLITRANLELAVGKLDTADRDSAEATAIFDHLGLSDDVRVGRGQQLRGYLARERHDLDRALEHQQRALATFERIDDRGAIPAVLVEIANLHKLRGEVEEADALFVRAIGAVEPGSDPLLEATVATNLGNLRIAQRRAKDAEQLFRRALQLGESYLGPAHPVLIRRLCNLAGACGQLGQMDEAEHLLERAVALGASVDSRYDDGVANALTNLGNVRGMRGQLREALELWARAEQILARRLGEESPAVADILENMAIAHERLGAADEAAALRARVEAIRARSSGRKPR